MKKPTAVPQLVRVHVIEFIKNIRLRFENGSWTSEDLQWLIGQAEASARMIEAIGEWHEDWYDHYDGEPLKSYEAKMLDILESEERRGISAKKTQ